MHFVLGAPIFCNKKADEPSDSSALLVPIREAHRLYMILLLDKLLQTAVL